MASHRSPTPTSNSATDEPATSINAGGQKDDAAVDVDDNDDDDPDIRRVSELMSLHELVKRRYGEGANSNLQRARRDVELVMRRFNIDPHQESPIQPRSPTSVQNPQLS